MPILAFILALTTAAVPLGTAEYVPANDEAYTLDLEVDGYVNGAMDSDRLMTTEGCTLERDAAYMYALMMEAAAKDGIRLGYEDCYRSKGSQAAAYNRRCPVVETPILEVDPLTGTTVQVGTNAERVCSGPPTARPGHSNHGWGRAVDFTDGSGVLGCRDTEFRWLQGNAYRFGWVHPSWAECGKPTQEPWHWEFGGVTTPSIISQPKLNPELLEIIR